MDRNAVATGDTVNRMNRVSCSQRFPTGIKVYRSWPSFKENSQARYGEGGEEVKLIARSERDEGGSLSSTMSPSTSPNTNVSSGCPLASMPQMFSWRESGHSLMK